MSEKQVYEAQKKAEPANKTEICHFLRISGFYRKVIQAVEAILLPICA